MIPLQISPFLEPTSAGTAVGGGDTWHLTVHSLPGTSLQLQTNGPCVSARGTAGYRSHLDFQGISTYAIDCLLDTKRS